MSDHFSGPAVMGDPAVDITDFYAFPSPERPGNLVLIMDVFPMATPQSFFSDVVTHRFRLRPLTRSGGQLRARHGRTHASMSPSMMCRKGPPFRKGTSSHRTGARRASSLGNRSNRMACASSRDWSATRSSWMSRPRSAPTCRAHCPLTRKAPTPFSFATSCRSSSRSRLLRSSSDSMARR